MGNNIDKIQTLIVLVLFLCITADTGSYNGSEYWTSIEASIGDLIPKGGQIEYRVFEGQGRRRLAPFKLCLLCKCCAIGGDPSTCSSMPCCFGIDCQLPGKPFGVCAFVPKTCNCTSCAM